MSKDGKMIEQIRRNAISINKLNEFVNLHNERMVKGLKKANNIENNQSQEEKDIREEISTKRKDECIIVSGKLSFCSHVDKKYNYKEKDLIARKVLEGGFYYCEGCGKTINGDVNTNEWKDLDINNLTTFPKDFFTNTNIEIEISDGGEFKPSLNKLEHRIVIIQNMKATDWEYRYRLKPLESIRIPKKFSMALYSYCIENDIDMTLSIDDDLVAIDGRKVEII